MKRAVFKRFKNSLIESDESEVGFVDIRASLSVCRWVRETLQHGSSDFLIRRPMPLTAPGVTLVRLQNVWIGLYYDAVFDKH